MTTADRPREELLSEIESLRFRLEEAEETLRAIGNGEVDAFVVSGPEGDQVFTLKGTEQPYRILVETMNEGAATLADDGTILYCNGRLAAMLQVPMERLIGTPLGSYVAPAYRPLFTARLDKCTSESAIDEIALITLAGDSLPVLTSCCTLDLSGSRGISVVLTDLTQHKRNEEILSSERLALSIIEQAGEAIVVCDEGGRIIRVSWLARQLCAENLLLASFDEMFLLRTKNTEEVFSVVPVLRGESFEKVEVEFKRRDGKKFYLVLNATPLYCAENRIIGGVVTLTDVSELRQSEEELRVAYERISDLLEQMSDGFASFDHDWRYTNINSAAARAFHIAPEQLLGKTIWEMWPAAYELPVGVNFRRAVQENIPIQFETYYPAPLERWFECRCYPTREGLATFLNDITERKHAEEALRESEQRFRSIFDQSLDAVFLTVPNGGVLDANPAACKIFGMTVQEFCQLGRTGTIDSNDIRLAQALEERQRTGQVNTELTCIRKNGERFPAEVSSVIVPGEPPRSFVFVRDITERKRAEEALKKAHDKLEQRVALRTEELALTVESLQEEIMERAQAEKSLSVETAERLLALEALREKEQMLIQQSRLAAMGEMIGNIAHQWRQPLNLLGLMNQKLLMYYDMGEFDRNFLAENVENSMKLIHHMSKTIDDFRNFFKPDKEKSKFKVQETITDTLTLLEGSLYNPPIKVEIVANDDPVINGYANEFAQVILNLIVNAKDVFTEREIKDAKLTITVSGANGCAVVTVADNAGGVPEAIIDKIFEPYFTTKGPQGGTGVGLFMSKTIIEKNMGGKLAVCNNDQGAEFRIEVCN
jgi:PAS domain S-box-containing protein